jgi:hypothetical protein
MSTVQEIQNAISELPEPERLRLLNWIHAQEENEMENDSKTLRQAEEGARQLDSGQGVSIAGARAYLSSHRR